MPRPDVSNERIPQILEAALDLFSRKGIDGSGMAELAAVTGLSKAAIYHYFPGKEAIVLALVEQFFAVDHDYLNNLATETGSAGGKIMGYVEYLSRFLDGNRALLPVFFEIYSRAERDRGIRTIVVRNYRRYQRIIEGLIRDGLAAKEFAADTDPAGMSATLVSLIEGCVLVAGVSGQRVRPILKRDVGNVLKAVQTK